MACRELNNMMYIDWRTQAVNAMFTAAPVAFRAKGNADGVL
jgi:hypothetical protein